jgi:hypothetical protein
MANLVIIQQFNKIIENIDCASRRTFRKFIYYLPEYISKSFRKDDIKSGWFKCGLYPVDVVRILKFWPDFDTQFKKISQEDGTLDEFLDSLKKLSVIGYQNGYVTDKNIIDFTEDIIPTAAANKKEIFDFENFTFNRWRAVWMNNAGTLTRRTQWKKNKNDAIVEADKKREKKKLSKIENAQQKEKTKKKKSIMLIKIKKNSLIYN